jgi:hypothetical protein
MRDPALSFELAQVNFLAGWKLFAEQLWDREAESKAPAESQGPSSWAQAQAAQPFPEKAEEKPSESVRVSGQKYLRDPRRP